MIGEVGGRALIVSLGALVDMRRLGQTDAHDRLTVERTAVHDQGEGVVGYTRIGVHAAAVG